MNKHLYRLVWRHCRVDVVPAPETACQRTGAAPASRTRAAGRRSAAAPGAPASALTRLCLACVALVSAAVSAPAWATCTVAGSVVTCSGAANPLAPSFSNATNNLQVNVNSGAGVGVLLGIGGTAMTLTGNNVTLVNGGTIDPSVLGSLGLLASGTVIGNGNAGGSTQTVTNNAIMRGTVGLLGVNLPGLTGLALAVQNAAGGNTVINNSGTLGASPILGVSLTGTGSAPVVAAYGGGAVNFTNTGTVLGRIAFQANGVPGGGNTFTNDGTISGSVSLGAGGANTFTAVTGSTLNDGGSIGLAALPVTGFNLGFAATGTVDGGAGGNNTLMLSNSANNNTTIGTGTLNGASYVNFSQATVNGGTWTLNGPLAVTATTLNGGLAIFNDPGSFGTGSLVVNGGGMQAANAGLALTLPVTLGANGLTVSGSNPLVVSGVLSGAGGVSLTGTGSLTLSGANTYTGGTSLSSGTLIAGNNSALGSGVVQVSGASAVLDASGPRTLINPIAVGGGSTLTFGGSAPLTLAGQISGSGNVVKQGAQTVTLTGINTFSGGVNLVAGTLALSGAGTLQVAGTALTLSGSGAAFDISNANGDRTIAGLSGVANTRIVLGAHNLTLGNSASGAFAGVINGTGGIIKANGDTQTLSGANTYTGGTTINAGGIALGAGGSLASTGAVSLLGSGTAFDISQAGAQTIGALSGVADSTVSLGGATLTFGDGNNESFDGSITGNGGIVKQGTGTQTLSGPNTFSGPIAIDAGTLSVGGTGTLSGNAVNVAGGAAFDISNGENQTIGALSGAAGSAVNLGDNTLSFGDATDQTFGGAIHGNGGGIVKFGTGTQTLTGQQTFTGGVVVGGGALVIGAGGGLSSQSAVSLGDNTTSLDIGGAGAQTIGSLSGGAAQVRLGANTLTFGDNTGQTFTGSIHGTGALIKQGAGVQTLTGASDFAGGVTVNAGGLALGNATALGSGALTMADQTTLDTTQATTLANNITLNGTSAVLGSQDLTLTGNVSGVGALQKTGSAQLVIDGAGTWTGGTTINDGTLALGAGGALASQGAVALGSNTATFDISAAGNRTVGALSGSGGSVALGANTLTFGDATDQTLGAAFNGTGGIVKQGTGTQTLTAAQTFTGGVDIAGGTLAIGTGGSLQAANALTLSGANTVFDIGAAGPTTVGALTGVASSAIALGTQTLTFGNALDETFDGVFHGTGAIVKAGPGVQTLTGASDFTGGTTVNAGGLIVGNNLALGTGALTIASNATLDSTQAVTLGNNVNLTGTLTVLGPNDVTLNGVLAGLGGLTKSGNATLTLGGSNTYTGPTTINAGTLALGAGASLNAAGTIIVANGATFDLSAGNGTQTIGALYGTGTVNLGGVVTRLGDAGNDTFGGNIAGTGSLVKVGVGTQTLTGQNAYTGGTTVQAGTLALSGAGALASSGALSLSGTGATFDISGANGPRSIGALSGIADSQIDLGANTLTFGDATGQNFDGVISGTGGIVKQGAGSARLDGVQLYTGTTTVADGALFVGRTGSLAAGAHVVVDGVNASLDLSDAGDQTIGSLSGTSGVVALSHNTLTFGDASDETLAAAIQGLGNVVKQGTGTQTLTGENLLAGMLTVADGAVVLGAGGSLLNMTDVTLNAGTSLDVSAATAPTIGALNGAAGSTLRIGGRTITLDSGNNGTFGGALSGAGGIVKQGSGTQTLSGGLVLPGTVQINAGRLALRGGTQLDSAAVSLNGSTSVLDVAAGPTQVVSTLTGVAGSVIGLDHATLRFGTAGDNTLASDIHGAGGQLVKVGNGVQTLSGNSDFGGGMNVQAGGILVGSNTALGTGTVTFADATSLDATQATTLGNRFMLNGNLDVLGTHDLTLNGAVFGGGGITKNGSATLTLNGENTYIGATNVNAGTLALGAGASLDAGGVVDVQTGATFDLSAGNGTQTFGALTGGGAINMGGNVLEVGSSGADETFSGSVAGTGSLVKMGTGVETMTGTSTFTGGTVVQAGTLSLAGAGTLATTGAVTLQNAGATLDISAANGGRTVGALTAQAGTNVTLGNNTLTFGDASSHTVSGTISGTGGIVKQGSGTQTLTGQQQFTGTTTIDDGTLALGATGKLAAGANVVVAGSQAAFDISAAGDQTIATLSGSGGNVNLGSSTLTFGDGSHQTLTSAINGTGGIVKAGAGTQTLAGQNTFSGDIDITNGTLALGAGGALSGSNNVTLAGGTTLDVSQASAPATVTIAGLDGAAGSTVSLGAQSLTLGGAANSTFDGVIQGNGGITKQGNATVTLGGNNTYSGGTTVNGGTVAVTSPTGLGTGGLTLTQGTVATQGVDVTLPSLTGTAQGALTIDGGSVTVSSGNFGGSVSGSGGLTKTGGGTLTLSGNNPLTGPTTVAGGTLGIGNLGHSPVTVQAGGTLTTPAPTSAGGSGTGAQTGAVTGASGSQIVVSSPGTSLGVGGNLTLQPGSTLQVNVAPGTPPSQVNATGSASVGGSNLVVNAAPGTQPADASGAVIVSAANGVSGQFASTSTNLLYLSPQVSYTPNTVLLSFTPNGTPLPAGGITPNQKAVALAVSTLGTSSPLYQAALGLTAETAPAAFASLDGSLHASIATMLLSQSQVTRDAASQRLRDSLLFADDCGTGSHVGTSELTTPRNHVDCRGQRRATQAWASVYGSDGQLRAASVASGGAGASTLHRRGMGVLVGVDTPIAETWRAGVLGGLGHDTFNTGPTASGNSNDAQMGAYVSRRFGHLGAMLGGSYALQQISSQRAIVVGPIAQTARASYDAATWQVFGEAAWRFDMGRVGIEPFAAMAHAWVRTDAFNESGSAADLHADEQTRGVTFSTLGVRGDLPFGTSTGTAALGRVRLSAGWRHAFGADTPDAQLAFVDSAAGFTVGGVPIARDAAIVEAGIDAFVGQAVTLGVSYTGQFGSQVTDNAVFGNLNWRF
ncbi:Adhesin BmaC autotransporter [Pandoraea iniqua]|uniref:Adhesin BmaC autotransporter n=1 Tax=Pandoraea iniqua TaxID=2508288 RepID=A0A5E4SNW0_9BURK|nr:autotransporter-associated beta strand repeat-containing protein [Pandoraea iniqua]VVD76583.1 Adhesin BmaC autotransporter [Pandoraea iniqua]